MFGNLLLWVENLRLLSRSTSVEYVLEVELYLTSRTPLPTNDYGGMYWPPECPNQKFPYYVMNADSDKQDILATFYQDVLNLIGQDVSATVSIAA